MKLNPQNVSSTFIIMCNVKEIQSRWSPTAGDRYLHDYHDDKVNGVRLGDMAKLFENAVWTQVLILCYQPTENLIITSNGQKSTVTSSRNIFRKNNIWLPYMHQILALVDKDMVKTIQQFSEFIDGKQAPIDELCIQFFMKKKYSKIWATQDIKWEVVKID